MSYTVRAESNSFDVNENYTGILTSVDMGDTIGFLSGVDGSISPTTFLGLTISGLSASINESIFSLVGGGALLQNAFTSITVGGVTKLSITASSYSSGTWVWWPEDPLVSAEGSIAVTITI